MRTVVYIAYIVLCVLFVALVAAQAEDEHGFRTAGSSRMRTTESRRRALTAYAGGFLALVMVVLFALKL